MASGPRTIHSEAYGLTSQRNISEPLRRARRLVQLIDRRVARNDRFELAVDVDSFDLLTYRLAELGGLAGLPDLVERQLKTGWSGIDPIAENRRETVDKVIAFMRLAKLVLAQAGADPDDRSLDGIHGRFERAQSAAKAMEAELRRRGVAAVYVFGSVSRGEDRPDSDVDIAIEISPSHEGFDAWDLGWVSESFREHLDTEVDVIDLGGISDDMLRCIGPELRRLL